jgi:hypothetical protein
MTTLRGIAQPSDCLLTHILLAYWRKLLAQRMLQVYPALQGRRYKLLQGDGAGNYPPLRTSPSQAVLS